jgi:hypothetical protein
MRAPGATTFYVDFEVECTFRELGAEKKDAPAILQRFHLVAILDSINVPWLLVKKDFHDLPSKFLARVVSFDFERPFDDG